ncbi:MAG: SoxR reducing system RseC family protein [Cardiobacteriaceae bacterium]|nr:SoxR reducing system RseC family protein [Cardiobacteriaceae bacterium]
MNLSACSSGKEFVFQALIVARDERFFICEPIPAQDSCKSCANCSCGNVSLFPISTIFVRSSTFTLPREICADISDDCRELQLHLSSNFFLITAFLLYALPLIFFFTDLLLTKNVAAIWQFLSAMLLLFASFYVILRLLPYFFISTVRVVALPPVF